MRQGADWIESLWRHRLIRATDAEVLASAAAVGNLGWALLELAETAERRLATRFQMVIQTLFPLVVVMLGMAVFVLAMAYFVPLVQLITELTQTMIARRSDAGARRAAARCSSRWRWPRSC